MKYDLALQPLYGLIASGQHQRGTHMVYDCTYI